MKVSSFRAANVVLLSSLLAARYISAQYLSFTYVSPTSTATITITETLGATGVAVLLQFDAPNGPVATTVDFVYISAQTASNSEDQIVTQQYDLEDKSRTSASPVGPQNNQTMNTTSPIFMQSTTPPTAATYQGSIAVQSVTPATTSTDQGSITIQSVTPAATSTASAPGTSGVRSVGSKYAWSTSLILPWIAVVLSI